MSSALKDKIKSLMHEKSLRTSELERLAGLKSSTVRNILLEKTRHPKAETIQALADVFGCSVADLLGKNTQKIDEKTDLILLEKPDLLKEAINELLSLIALEKEKTITLQQALKIIEESYIYSQDQNQKSLDKKFEKWIFKKLTE